MVKSRLPLCGSEYWRWFYVDVKFICMMTHYSQSNTCLHIQDEICYTKYNEKKGPFRTGIGFGEQDASFRLLCLASVLFFFCRRGSSSPTRRCSSRICSAKCLLGCVDQVQEPILVLLFPECNSMLWLIFLSPNLPFWYIYCWIGQKISQFDEFSPVELGDRLRHRC